MAQWYLLNEVIVGAQLGGRLIHRFGTIQVVRGGLVLYEVGLLLMLHAISLHLTALGLFPGLALYGMGIGFALAQLTNVVLSEIPPDGSGVASGASVAQSPSARTRCGASHATAAAYGQPPEVPATTNRSTPSASASSSTSRAKVSSVRPRCGEESP